MIDIFTDGSTIFNQIPEKRRGGIGVYFGENDKRNISEEIKYDVTNQRMELLACIEGIKKCNSDEINIYTDSMYVINSITKWIKNWEVNNWKNAKGQDVKNKDLIVKLNMLTTNKKINFFHVKSHQKKPNNNLEYKLWYGNKMADYLATNSINNDNN